MPTLVRLPKDSSVATEAWRSLEAQRNQRLVFHAQRPICASTDLQWLHGSERESYAYRHEITGISQYKLNTTSICIENGILSWLTHWQINPRKGDAPHSPNPCNSTSRTIAAIDTFRKGLHFGPVLSSATCRFLSTLSFDSTFHLWVTPWSVGYLWSPYLT